MGRVRVGLSGWSYDGWRDAFYPHDVPKRQWLEYVGERFDTVEINGSFYSLQKPSSYRSWYAAVPASFRFALKGGRFITHHKKLRNVEAPLGNFFASGPLALKEKMGPVLWQLPSNQRFQEEKLRDFLALLPRDFEGAARLAREHSDRVEEPYLQVEKNHRIRHALEARHESFFTEGAVRVLREGGVALAVSHAGRWQMREEVTAGFVYVRLHGAPDTYRSGYGPKALDGWAEKIRVWSVGKQPEGARTVTDRAPPRRKGRDIYVYFDNDAAVRAPVDALELRERLR
jgi:uncharacterized protein YecE (DUF72 family)